LNLITFACLKMEPETGANQVLAQIATLTGVDLGAGIIEVVILDKGAELRGPIVIAAGDDLPGEIIVALTSAGAKAATRRAEVETGGFRKVNADPRTGIRLESPKREPRDEVAHECTSVNKAGRAAVSQDSAIRQREGSVSATSKAVIKEVPFNGRTKYACAKDVTEFDAAEKADIIFWINSESISKLVFENSRSTAVLIDIRPHVNCAVKTGSVKNWRRWRCNLLVFRRSGQKRAA
jgi:hypothetical protein